MSITAANGISSLIEGSKAVVVAIGSSAAMPPVGGLERGDVSDSREVTSAEQVPRRLLIIGGGVARPR